MEGFVTVVGLNFFLTLLFASCGGNEAEDAAAKAAQFEAAFQGRCDRGSPCDQLCYELHDGMYECDCNPGFDLQEDGYSCSVYVPEMNTTASPLDEDPAINTDEDVLYQKDAIFDAELNFPNYTEYYSNSQFTLNITENTIQKQQQWQLQQHQQNTGRKFTQDSGDMATTISQSSTVSSQTPSISTMKPCTLDCGPGGGCIIGGEDGDTTTCLCPLGRGGERCEKEISSHRSGKPVYRLAEDTIQGESLTIQEEIAEATYRLCS